MAFDAFLELEKGGQPAVSGESLDSVFKAKKAMEIQSFKLNSQRDMSDGAASAALSDDQNLFTLTITKDIDNASPDLFLAYCKYATTRAITFDLMRLSVRKAAGLKPMVFCVMEFTNVFIKSWKLDNSDGDALPEEKIDFAFNTLKMQYTPQTLAGTASGSVKEGYWDFRVAEDK